jgi:hypothetical protein
LAVAQLVHSAGNFNGRQSFAGGYDGTGVWGMVAELVFYLLTALLFSAGMWFAVNLLLWGRLHLRLYHSRAWPAHFGRSVCCVAAGIRSSVGFVEFNQGALEAQPYLIVARQNKPTVGHFEKIASPWW